MGLALLKTDDTTTAPTIAALPDPAPAAPKRRGKVSLGALATATTTSKAAKTYPVAELTDEQKELVSELLKQKDQAKSLKGSIESLGKDLNGIVLPQWITLAQGQLTPASSMIVPGMGKDEGMLVIAGDTGGRYTGIAEAAAVDKLAELVGEDAFAEAFTEKIELKIDFEKVAEEKQQALVDALLAVFVEHNAMHAVTTKTLTTFRPLARKSRFQTFTLEQNLAIHGVLPIIPSLKRRA